jgi:Mg/Co/Ni transporter MgtE
VIRASALGEVTFRDWAQVFRREMAMGFGLGITLGTIEFLRVALPQTVTQAYKS